MKPKTQRLVLVAAALAAVFVAVLLAMWGLRDRASYFYTPLEIAAGRAEPGRAVRLGGMVERGSVAHEPDGLTTSFRVTDGAKSVPVRYRGILPNLFREGSGVVAEGQVEIARKGTPPLFIADNILAKHDERYMPPEIGNVAAEHRAGETLDK